MAKKPDYSAMTRTQLNEAEAAAVAAFDEKSAGEVNAAVLAELTAMAEDINEIRAAQAAIAEVESNRDALAAMVHGKTTEAGTNEEPAADETVDGETPEVAEEPELVSASGETEPVIDAAPEPTPEPVADPEPVATTEKELVMASATTPPEPKKTDVRDVLSTGNKLNASLASASKFVPQEPDAAAPRRESVLVASADIPGFQQGGRLATMDQLTEAMHKRARALPNMSQPVVVASLQRDFEYVLNETTSLSEMESIFKAARNPEKLLTAAGGWCAPNEISYDFYNIVCEDGMVDLPTVGVRRGGLSWPISPSFGDLAGQVWSWNETQDIAAVTGTEQSGVKPCYRVPCASYTSARLACDGLCLTVGNLMDYAFPELIANHMRLLFAAQAHYTNAKIIQSLVSQSTAVQYTTPTGHGVAAPVLEAIEMQVIDYRTKFRMCEGSILEAIFPNWIYPMFRADLAKRHGMALFDVTDQMIANWFTMRGIRVQLVQDWQVGGVGQLGQSTPAEAWPATLDFLLYAAGTFVRGQGMTLDLGVVRDSTLNATNDFTAAWMEECYLVAKMGHESRLVTLPICPNGVTAEGIDFACAL